MNKTDTLTKILAIVGTVLVALPTLAPLLLGLVALAQDGNFRFDYLMPAELFPVVLAGACLLVWAALRARARRRIIGWGVGIAIVAPLVGQALAAVTGLASGDVEPGGWQWALVVAMLVIFWVGLIVLAIGGALLVGDLSRRRVSTAGGGQNTPETGSR